MIASGAFYRHSMRATTSTARARNHPRRCALVIVCICVMGIFTGCQRHAKDDGPEPKSLKAAVADSTPIQDWRGLVEDVRRNRLSRIESELLLGDEELDELAGMTSLKEIELPNANVSDRAAESIASLLSLEVLVLGNTTISDLGLERFARLQSLRTLNLNESLATDRGLERLAALPRLALLRLGTSKISDDGLVAAGRMTSLRFLILQNARITGRGFKHLYSLKNLESLYLNGNPLTDEYVEGLRRSLPELHPDW
jgi:Leucine-rich repeat (LRR) protein